MEIEKLFTFEKKYFSTGVVLCGDDGIVCIFVEGINVDDDLNYDY